MSEVTTELIKSPIDGFSFSAARVQPKAPRKGGVVVIQEIFGVTEHIREICRFYASQGYEALAPSLYDRVEARFEVKGAIDAAAMEKGVKAAMATPFDQVVADVQATIGALGSGPLYITGFCYGGAISWLAAARCTGLAAASGFYGGAITRLLDQKPRIPLILHYGSKDPHIPMSEVDKVRAAAPEIPVYVYEAGHGFARENSADYHQPSATLALSRTLEHFERSAGK
jgi:carboxymethylenebutenolidase